jgi:catechol 2,3-dioxygenase-like lactoylglutathione lyase family enzyme
VDAGRPETHARHRAAREDPGGVAAVLTRIDHVSIGVADLRAGIDAYRRIGFDVDDGGVARNDGDYLELSSAGREGLRSIALRSDALDSDSAAMRARGSVDYARLVAARPTQPAGRHPNGVQRIERVYIAVADVAAAAAKWMADHGVPPPKRGVRNTGEQAMLVTPEHACGVYVGFVGPA